jgi:hypothetical protein
LDMLRTEFDRLDEYWQVLLEEKQLLRSDWSRFKPITIFQSKLDEEREIYDQERDSTDEKFRSLELKIKGKLLITMNEIDKFLIVFSSFILGDRIRGITGTGR